MKTLRFAAGKTVNTGNFNSVRLDYEETVQVHPGEDEAQVYAQLRERVFGRLYSEVQAVLAVEVKR